MVFYHCMSHSLYLLQKYSRIIYKLLSTSEPLVTALFKLKHLKTLHILINKRKMLLFSTSNWPGRSGVKLIVYEIFNVSYA